LELGVRSLEFGGRREKVGSRRLKIEDRRLGRKRGKRSTKKKQSEEGRELT